MSRFSSFWFILGSFFYIGVLFFYSGVLFYIGVLLYFGVLLIRVPYCSGDLKKGP